MKRLWWCLAVFVIALALGNLVAPPLIESMKPLDNGTYTLEWTDGSRDELTIAGTKKDATVSGDGFELEISRYSTETDRGLVFFFPWEPDRRSFQFYDPRGDVTGTIDYVDPGTVAGLRTLRFYGTFTADGYEAERTFDVERRTGTLIDATWTSSGTTHSLTDETREAHVALAASRVRVLWWLQLLAWVSRFIAFVSAAVAVAEVVRRARR